jgi:hypothetical protein
MMQTALPFQPGLTAQFPYLEDLLSAVVYGSKPGLDGCAAACDMSPSELCRRLNRHGDDARPLRVQDMLAIVAKTGDVRPVHWQVEKFTQSPEALKAQALAQLNHLVPMIAALAEQAGVAGPAATARKR